MLTAVKMRSRARTLPSPTLWRRLALASLGTALAIGGVCAVALSSLANTGAVTRVAVTQQLALIDDAAAMAAFQYQKGFVAEYLLSGNPIWLAELETSRPAFESWLERAHTNVTDPGARRLLDDIEREYTAYDAARRQAISLYDAGQGEAARVTLQGNHARTQRLWDLFHDFGRQARAYAERTLADSERNVRRLTHILVGSSIAGALASLFAGFLWARRVTRPIYALVEETDAALAEHRQRLMQSEKLSAVGELAAKLAHEVLNPLAGMKAATQLLARQGAGGADGREVLETAEALNREITRVEGLVRRLVNFSRPLAPRFETAAIGTLFDAALEAVQPVLKRHAVAVERAEEAGLRSVEVDPLLFTQVLVNLLVNAAEAMGPAGGAVELSARRARAGGRDQISIRVADRGPGIPTERLPQLFKPFFTTKPDGHGLGLAVSQNIVLEHGGRIVAQNRPSYEGTGAAFEVQIPASSDDETGVSLR
jgi:signal transduction histidine kinase